MRYPDPWLEHIIEQEVSRRLRDIWEKIVYGLMVAGVVGMIIAFGHGMWILGHKAACG
jgi:hypothetical protein